MKRFYSSLNLAAQDINQETVNTDTTVADLETVDNATCGVYYSGGTYRIELYKDVDNQDNLSFEKNTKLNLNEHKVTFAEKNGIVFNSSFTIQNGTLNNVASPEFISTTSSNIDGVFKTENIVINQEVPNTITTNVFTINLKNKTAIVKNTTINQNGEGNAQYQVVGLRSLNDSKDGFIKTVNYTQTSNVKYAKYLVGIMSKSNIYDSKSVITLICDEGLLFGLYFLNDITTDDSKITISNSTGAGMAVYGFETTGDAVINNVTIDIKTNTAQVEGIRIPESHNKLSVLNSHITISGQQCTSSPVGIVSGSANTSITGCNVFVESQKANGTDGAGILFRNHSGSNQTTVIENCEVYGKQWGIQTSQNGLTIIKKCNVSATDHSAYITGNANIYNSNFFIANRDKYTDVDTAYGLYCGAATENIKAIVNFYDCTIGSADDLTKNTFNGIVSQGHYTGRNYTPAEINLYNTDIYTTQRAFTYNIGADDIPIITKFNLYGKTQIYVYNQNSKKFDTISKETLNDEIMTWKTMVKEKESTGHSMYNRGIIFGNEVGVVDESTGSLKYIRVTDDANVYDYRN